MNFSLKRSSAIAFGAEPRADLLPPEVRSAARARSTQHTLGIVVAVVIVVVVGAYGATALRATQAQSGLADSQARTVAIAKEKAKYAEATILEASVGMATQARTYSVSTEVLWNNYFTAISAALPAGVVLTSTTMTGHTPWAAVLPVSNNLQQRGVASITVVVTGKNVLDQTALTRSLSTLTGFAGATIDSVTSLSGIYAAHISLNLSSAALSGRFPPAPAAPAAPAAAITTADTK